ncbi:hypothetical protein [Methylotuvimicrobium sp. KM1]|uniref:hypothetical protein n=1 Tax=Methylotuvimicrobium sp. KM1 TaxID=3377707 RepID=UPI00384C1745
MVALDAYEQSLKLVSFRPLLRIPRIVPLIGASGCLFAMFIIDVAFGGIAIAVVIILHTYLVHKRIKAPFGDVRSGLFTALAEWAASKVASLAGPREKTWKANVLVPVEDSRDIVNVFPLLRDIARPNGFVRLLGLTGERNYHEMTKNLPDLTNKFEENQIFSTWTVIDAATFPDKLAAGIEALGGAFFRSSMIVLPFPESGEREEKIRRIIQDAQKNKLGALLVSGEEFGLSARGGVHLIIDRPENGWKIGIDLGKTDLAFLLAYKLKRNRKTSMVLTAYVSKAGEDQKALEFMEAIVELARIPNVKFNLANSEEEFRVDSGDSAITIFSITDEVNFREMQKRIHLAKSPCLFVMDSGWENALA